jgi:hypothetical protein
VDSRLAVVRTGETRQRIYVTDYPPSSPESYKLVADLPNCLEIGALAWCRSDLTHLAFAANVFEGDRLPDVENWAGLESWRKAKGMSGAEFEKRFVGKVFTVGTDGGEPQAAFSFDERPRSPFSGEMAWAGGDAIYFAMYGNVYRGTIDKGGGHSKARALLAMEDSGELAHLALSSLDDEAKARAVLAMRESGRDASSAFDQLAFSADRGLFVTLRTRQRRGQIDVLAVTFDEGGTVRGEVPLPVLPGPGSSSFNLAADGDTWVAQPGGPLTRVFVGRTDRDEHREVSLGQGKCFLCAVGSGPPQAIFYLVDDDVEIGTAPMLKIYREEFRFGPLS